MIVLILILIISGCASQELENDLNQENFKASWSELVIPLPNNQIEYAMIFSKAKSSYFMYGGRDGEWRRANTTWAFDINQNKWVNLKPKISPNWRINHTMSIDPLTGNVYLFGGNDFTNVFNDTWVYHSEQNTWRKVDFDIIPPERQMHGMIYLPENHAFLVFGGRLKDGGAFFNDSWLLDIESKTWQKLNTSVSPSVQDHVVMDYHSGLQQVVLYENIEGKPPSIWVFSESKKEWKKVEEIDGIPKLNHAYIQDSGIPEWKVLFGVSNELAELQTWLYNHDSGKFIKAKDIEPISEYSEHVPLVYNPVDNSLILHGGCCFSKTYCLTIE